MVVSGSFDATVRLWDCKSPSTKPIQVLEEARDSVSGVWVGGHEVVTGSVDGRMRVYDLRMGMVFVDVVGRMWRRFALLPSPPAGGTVLMLAIWAEQNPSPRSSEPETGTQFWSRRWTRPSGCWTRETGRCYRAIAATRTRIFGCGPVSVWRTRSSSVGVKMGGCMHGTCWRARWWRSWKRMAARLPAPLLVTMRGKSGLVPVRMVSAMCGQDGNPNAEDVPGTVSVWGTTL